MSSNILIYTYQHTCKKGLNAYLLANAPFKSVKKKISGSNAFFIPFLGEGFYLWEENIDAAEYWGVRNYQSDHSVVQFKDCEINQDDLLDFLNRRDLQFFNDLKGIYINRRPDASRWNLGVWIEFFKLLQKKSEENFPYYFFRAKEEIPPEEIEKYNIRSNKIKLSSPGYSVDLNPFIMICITHKNKLKYKACEILP